MITIFAIPKPFDGHTAVIQRNAIRSWSLLEGVDVILVGDDAGVAEAAREIGAAHLPHVEKSAHGTPLLSSAFDVVRGASDSTVLAYANADIILLSDFAESIRKVRFDDFLLVGQRWNVDVRLPIAFEDPRWEQDLRRITAEAADLSEPNWIDYFVMPRDSALLADLPPFVVGRPMWDNWLIRQSRRLGLPLIDASPSITAVHQRHDYSHIPEGTGRQWEGPEAEMNTALFGAGSMFGIWHATYVLGRRRPVRALGARYLRERWETRDEIDGRLERLSRWVDPALSPARWVYRKRRGTTS